jgi:hypothetical protein
MGRLGKIDFVVFFIGVVEVRLRNRALVMQSDYIFVLGCHSY